MKAARNKTIDLSVEDGAAYLARCMEVRTPADLSAVLDRTILGDSFHVLPLLPKGFADLLIADPPYNLSKDFHGSRFARTDDESYEAYTRRWLDLALPLLKPDASVYVCCDWRSSLVIGRVLEETLTVRNRITWQREKGRGAKKNWKNAMEDIWFATASEDYYFAVDAVRQRRRVIAPYREDGRPKDWEETAEGRFRDTAPSNFWDTEAGKAPGKADPRELPRGRHRARPLPRLGQQRRHGQKAGAALRRHRAKPALLCLVRKASRTCGDFSRHSGLYGRGFLGAQHLCHTEEKGEMTCQASSRSLTR